MSTERIKLGESLDGREMHYSAGVILEHAGKYLMLGRKSVPYGFACPAGHIDEGEEPKEAALREVFEETGIKLQEVEPIFEEEVPWNYCRSATVHYWHVFRAVVDSEHIVINKEEESSLSWYSPEEIKQLELEPAWKYWLEKSEII
jgi:8-oxo-dGTP pyrophosphatase MutT (NUDIX family)